MSGSSRLLPQSDDDAVSMNAVVVDDMMVMMIICGISIQYNSFLLIYIIDSNLIMRNGVGIMRSVFVF